MEATSYTQHMNLKTMDCELSETLRSEIEKALGPCLATLPRNSDVNLLISNSNQIWNFDISARYNRGHIAVNKSAASLEQAIRAGLLEFTKNLQDHHKQYEIETFHFDKTGEFDCYTEVSTESSAQPKKRIQTLVVEDDPAAAAILKSTLKSVGSDVDHRDLPSEGLRALVEHQYDLLVLDWNLPYMKGSQFLIEADKLLRQAGRDGQPVRQIPVVICTSLPLEEITLPPVTHFYFYNHWHKGLPFSSVFGSVEETTQKVSARQQFAA